MVDVSAASIRRTKYTGKNKEHFMNLIRSQFDGQDKKVNTPADEAVDIVTSRESEVTHEQHP